MEIWRVMMKIIVDYGNAVLVNPEFMTDLDGGAVNGFRLDINCWYS